MKKAIFILLIFLVGCGGGGGESSTGTLYAEIIDLEVLYGVDSDIGPGYQVNATFKNLGYENIDNAYWHIYSEPHTWDVYGVYINGNNSINVTTEIFMLSFYGQRYFTISLYDFDNNMLATKTVISGYI